MFEEFMRLWRTMDLLFEHVEEHPWGAVVTDARFPWVHDANYARVNRGEPASEEVLAALLPGLDKIGARETHVVMMRPETSTGLIAAFSTAGHRLGWDVVMAHDGPAPAPASTRAEPRERDAAFSEVVAA